MNVKICGAGMTRFGKRSESLLELLREAGYKAMEDSGCASQEIDALFIGAMNPDEFTGTGHIATAAADALGISGIPAFRIETGMSSGAGLFHAGVLAVSSGIYKRVLLIGCEKMTHLPTQDAVRILSKVIHPKDREIGGTMAELASFVTRKYMERYGLDRETMALVPVKNHRNALDNEYAQFRKAISVDDVVNGRVVAEPLTVYDCAPISDGACAVVISDESVHKGDVCCVGIGHGTEVWSLAERKCMTSFNATKIAARRAYDMAVTSPKSIQIAEIHDAFSAFEIIDMEDLGFYPAGEGGAALRRGETDINGKLPINTGGGLKARGHPIGASGLSQIIEIYWQLARKAGKRQVDGVKTGLAQSIGGLASNNLVTILKSA